MFGTNTSNTSLLGNPPAATTGMTSGFGATGFGNPGTVGTAGTLFSSTSMANTTAAKTGFAFAQPSTTSSLPSFGTATGGFGLTTKQPTTGFNFSSTAPTTAPNLSGTTNFPTLTGFNQPATGFGTTSLFSSTAAAAPTTTVSSMFGFGATSGQQQPLALTSSNISTSVGLGGVGTSSTTQNKNDSKTIKEYPLPPEIANMVEPFKNHIKTQKGIREEISHFSSKSLTKVVDETENLKQTLAVISNGLQRHASGLEKLKFETVMELKNAEIMLRTKDISFALQYENSLPMEYFTNLILDFEQRMILYKEQIESLEKHLHLIQKSSPLTPQDLLESITKLNKAFIYVAAQMQTLQENINAQKEKLFGREDNSDSRFNNLLGNNRWPNVPTTIGLSPIAPLQSNLISAYTSAYERAQQITGSQTAGGLSSGFPSGLNTVLANATLNRSLSSTPLSLGASSTLKLPLGGTSLSGGTASLPTTPVFGVANPIMGTSAGFQLQSPPIGNKRGKR